MDGDPKSFTFDADIFNWELPPEFTQRPRLIVYLASALTGREQQKSLDDATRGAIRDVFSKAECLALPYRLRYETYDPAEHTFPGTSHRSEEVYHTDFKHLVESDLALFFLNSSSLGMGIERQIAAMSSIPAAWDCRNGDTVSRMFEGTFGECLFNISFGSVEELKLKLSDAVARHGLALYKKACRRRRIMESLSSSRIPLNIFKRRLFLHKTVRQVAEETGISAYWFRQLERDPTGVIVSATLTPILFCQLAETLDARWGCSSEGSPYFKADQELTPVAKASVENLYEAYVSRKEITDDDIIFDLWEKQTKNCNQSGQPLLDEPVSAGEWLIRFEEADRRLPDEARTSLENLRKFCRSLTVLPGPKTIAAMLEKSTKDRRRREAARKDRLSSYSVEDWQKVFNHLDLHE